MLFKLSSACQTIKHSLSSLELRLLVKNSCISNLRPYSRQVTKQLPLSGSFHSPTSILQQLTASNAVSSENHWFFLVHFNVHCRCISQSSFGQHLLCMFNNYITLCPWKIKNKKLHIWPIFTCINRTFGTGNPIHVNWFPLRIVRSCNSVYFVVRFPLSDERTWVTWQEKSIEADSESLLTAQPSHIQWYYKNYTQDIIYALCANEPSCWHSLKGHYPYNSIYPHPCWNDSNYSYPSLIHRGINVCGHSAIYRKLIAVEWVSDEQKECKFENVN